MSLLGTRFSRIVTVFQMKWMKTYYTIICNEPYYLTFDFSDWDFGFGFGWDTGVKRPTFKLYLGPFWFSIDWY